MIPDDPTDEAWNRVRWLARTQRAPLAAAARAEGVSPEDAVDCVQEALCTLLRRGRERALPVDDAQCAALGLTVVRNAARNRRRLHAVARPHGAPDDALVDDEASDAESLLLDREVRARLRVCLAGLCGLQRAVVTLRLLDEQPPAEVAAALQVSEAYVATLLYRARRALRACMDAPCERARPAEGPRV